MKKLWVVGFLFSRLLLGGNEAGNGGDVIFCDANSKWELLDFYEAKLVPPLRPIDLGKSTLTYLEKLKLVLDRLKVLDPDRARRYEQKIEQFVSTETTRWVRGMELVDIPDSGYVPTEGCHVRQIAIQKKPLTPLHRLYTLDEALWDRIDNDSRAGLVLHEIIYGEALKQGHRNSIATRKFTALLASRDLEGLSPWDYAQIIGRLFPPPNSVAFNSDSFEFLLRAGEAFSLNFSSLLAVRRRSPLRWAIIEPLPKWASLDEKTGVFSGTPPAGEAISKRYNLTVNDGIDGSVVPVTLTVLIGSALPPVWVVNPLILDVSPQSSIEADVSPFLVTDQKVKPDFQLFTGPTWLRISNDGILSGTPPGQEWAADHWTLSAQIGSSQANIPLYLNFSSDRDSKRGGRR